MELFIRVFPILQSPARIVSAFSLLLIPVLVLSCRTHKEAIRGTVKGTVYVIGNEPFTSLALEVSAGTVYRLSASLEARQNLLALQGRKVEVLYSKIDTTAEGITISVDEFREISP